MKTQKLLSSGQHIIQIRQQHNYKKHAKLPFLVEYLRDEGQPADYTYPWSKGEKPALLDESGLIALDVLYVNPSCHVIRC